MKTSDSSSSTQSVTPEMPPLRLLTSVHRNSAVVGITTADERVEDVDALTGGNDGLEYGFRTEIGDGLGDGFLARTTTGFNEEVDLSERGDGLNDDVDLDDAV